VNQGLPQIGWGGEGLRRLFTGAGGGQAAQGGNKAPEGACRRSQARRTPRRGSLLHHLQIQKHFIYWESFWRWGGGRVIISHQPPTTTLRGELDPQRNNKKKLFSVPEGRTTWLN